MKMDQDQEVGDPFEGLSEMQKQALEALPEFAREFVFNVRRQSKEKEDQFEQLKQQKDELQQRVVQVEQEKGELQQRIVQVEQEKGELQQRVVQVEQEKGELQQRFDEDKGKLQQGYGKLEQEKNKMVQFIVKLAAMMMASSSTCQSRSQLVESVHKKLSTKSVEEIFSNVKSMDKLKEVWTEWMKQSASLSIPAIAESEKPAYHEYMSALIGFIINFFQDPTQPLTWKVFRERGILFTGNFFAKFPDLLLSVGREIHPSIGGENLLFEFKRSPEGTPADQTLRQVAVAEAVDYASNNLRAAIEMTPAEHCNAEFMTHAIAANVTHINIIKISLRPHIPDVLPATLLTEDIFIEHTFESTGWLPLVPRLPTPEPTLGFIALVSLLTAPPETLMKLHSQLPNLDEITQVVIELKGADMKFIGRLGRGGFSDALRFSAHPAGSESPEDVVVKVIRSLDRPERAGLAHEIETLRTLNNKQCSGVPTLLYPPVDMTIDHQNFFVTGECGTPLMVYLRRKMPTEWINEIHNVMEMVVEDGEVAFNVSASRTQRTEALQGSSSSAAAAAAADETVEETQQEIQRSKKARLVAFSHDDSFASSDEGRAYKSLVFDVISKLKAIVNEVHQKTKLVHIDIRPANIVVFPFPDDNGIEKVMLIDWGSAMKADGTTTSFVGAPAYLSDKLVKSIPTTTASKVHSTVINCFSNMSVKIEKKFDMDALKHTHSVLLHGGNGFIPPWDHCQVDQLIECRREWYLEHKRRVPTCPCLSLCL
jgi:uncharacterized protein (UPF0147 family)